MVSPEDVNALLDAADYFRDKADRQRGIIATPGSETADDANFEAKRFDRWALACERASAAPVGQPGERWYITAESVTSGHSRHLSGQSFGTCSGPPGSHTPPAPTGPPACRDGLFS